MRNGHNGLNGVGALALSFVLAGGGAWGQTALKGDLRNSDRVVTNEVDALALAAVRGVSNTWAEAQAYDRASRASEDARVEGVASNLFAAAQLARYAGDTNLAAVLEVTRTNLLQHYTALVAAESVARGTNVATWAWTILSDSRETNTATRVIAGNALAAAEAILGVASNALVTGTNALRIAEQAEANRTTRLWNAGGDVFQDATGGVWRITTTITAWTVNIPFPNITFSITDLPPPSLWTTYPQPDNYTFSYGDYQLQVTCQGDTHSFVLVSFSGDYYNMGGVNVSGSETDNIPVTNIVLWSTHELPNASMVWTVAGVTTSRVDGVAWVSELTRHTEDVNPHPGKFALLANMPTNAGIGSLLYDYGSNDWVRLSISNRSVTLWEVTQ